MLGRFLYEIVIDWLFIDSGAGRLTMSVEMNLFINWVSAVTY